MSRDELYKLEKAALIERVLCLQKYICTIEDWNIRMWLMLAKMVEHEREDS